MTYIRVCLVTICCLICYVSGDGAKESGDPVVSEYKSKYFPLGDPRLCMELARDSKFPVARFEVLPGISWDNLQNKAKGQVVLFNYSRCLTTDDGRMLIPDNVFTIPLKASYVDTFAELIDTWHNTSSTTASSINVNAGLHIGFASISGSYSHEHTQIKEKQVEDKAVTVRVQLRYHRYKSQLQPGAQLHPSFKRRLLDIAAHLALNQTAMAHYSGQLIVRDFGTHVQTSVTAGAGLSKTDFLKRDFVATRFEDKTKVLMSASASYAAYFSGSVSHSKTTDTKDYQSYLDSTTHSYVTSHGGPLVKAFNMSANSWSNGVDMELVPMDRSGDPLSFLVTRETLPELPITLINEVEAVLRKSIVEYYEMNAIPGCTKMSSPNFQLSANFDDGSCETHATNMTFGGVFQTCDVTGQYLHHNPCDGMSQVNPKTRAMSCPPSYTPVKLATGSKTGTTESSRSCHHCGFLGFSRCCHNNYYTATAHYTAYWCAGLGQIEQDSGYLFGGIFSGAHDNPVTANKACPPHFYPRLFLDQQLCISDDFELGLESAVPFGGFISCSMGNPLSMPGVHVYADQSYNATPKREASINSLVSFMAESNDPSVWPKHCPHGYSQHLATIENGCEIRYCLKSGALGGPFLPKVKLPPFKEKPTNVVKEQGVSRIMFNEDTGEWIKNEQSFARYKKKHNIANGKLTWLQMWEGDDNSDEDDHSDGSSTLAPGIAAAIAVAVTTCCGLVAFGIYRGLQQRRHNKRSRGFAPVAPSTSTGSRLVNEDEVPEVSYGAVGGRVNDAHTRHEDCSVQIHTES